MIASQSESSIEISVWIILIQIKALPFAVSKSSDQACPTFGWCYWGSPSVRFRNKSMRDTDWLKFRITGKDSEAIMKMVNDQKITPLHLLCESSLCSRESIIKVKDIINDPNCLNAENSAGKTPYDSVRYFSQTLFPTRKSLVELPF